jgi:hypothetical protein
MFGPFTMSLALAGSLVGAGLLPAASVSRRPIAIPAVRWLGEEPVTLTGCLGKGDEKDEFRLTTADGKKYDVKSTKVPLAKHVGHTVRITGNSVAPEQGEENQGEAGEIEVTEMTHLSATCQQ